jgi:hypothetical protein
VRMSDLSDLGGIVDPSNSTLFIIGPSTPFTPDETGNVKTYLNRGGRLVLADDFGSGNELLDGLGLNVRFDGGLLEDPLFRERNMLLPTVRTDYVKVGSVVLNYATALKGIEDSEVTAWSSPFSILTPSGDKGNLGAEPIIADVRVGQGRLLLISDSSVFINGMIDLGDNKNLLRSLLNGVTIIDEAHSVPSRLTLVKGLLEKIYTDLSSFELRYGLAIVVVALIYMGNYDDRKRPTDEVETVMNVHPEYDWGLVERLRMERRKIRETS